MEKSTEAKRPYEVVILVHPDTNLEDQKELFRKNKSIIQGFKGTVNTLETWGKRNLANPLGKLKKAIYFHSTFETQPAAIAELERTMRINDKVLRFVHTRLDERVSLAKHMEDFKRSLQESAAREKEREAKIQMKRAAQAERAERGDSER